MKLDYSCIACSKAEIRGDFSTFSLARLYIFYKLYTVFNAVCSSHPHKKAVHHIQLSPYCPRPLHIIIQRKKHKEKKIWQEIINQKIYIYIYLERARVWEREIFTRYVSTKRSLFLSLSSLNKAPLKTTLKINAYNYNINNMSANWNKEPTLPLTLPLVY